MGIKMVKKGRVIPATGSEASVANVRARLEREERKQNPFDIAFRRGNTTKRPGGPKPGIRKSFAETLAEGWTPEKEAATQRASDERRRNRRKK